MARIYKRLRANTSVTLDNFTLAALADGYTLIASLPVGLIGPDNIHVIPSAAAELVKRHGIAEIRRLCEAEMITKPGQKLWVETMGKANEQ